MNLRYFKCEVGSFLVKGLGTLRMFHTDCQVKSTVY